MFSADRQIQGNQFDDNEIAKCEQWNITMVNCGSSNAGRGNMEYLQTTEDHQRPGDVGSEVMDDADKAIGDDL